MPTFEYTDLPSYLVRYFVLDLKEDPLLEKAKSLSDFIGEHDEVGTIHRLVSACTALEERGHLIQGSTIGTPILGRTYVAKQFDPRRAEYGEYNYAVDGFPRIAHELKSSVFPVVVERESGDQDIGTSFLVGNRNTVVTARHNVESMLSIKILDSQGNSLPIREIEVPEYDDLDLAVVMLENVLPETFKPLRVDSVSILDKVLCVGYPPIPGFESILVSDVAEVNSFLRISSGVIVASSNSYLDSQDYVLINARVKGGNSGGPIVNSNGYVVGVLVKAPISSTNSSQLDDLGYGIALPTSAIRSILKGGSTKMKPIFVSDVERGVISTKA